MRRDYKVFDLIVALFVTVLMLSNLLSSAKIIDFGISFGSIALIFDAGTLVFPIAYIFGDVLTEVYGYQRSRRVIWFGFLSTALLGLFVWLAGALPGESSWQQYAGQDAYNSILGGISGLVVASLLAYLCGGFTNSYVLARMKVAMQGKHIWMRTISSTLVGQIVDTGIFFFVATVIGVFPWSLFVSLVVTNYLFKVAIEVLFTPLTLMIVKALKRAEHEDAFDRNTDFNPFRLDTR
ncbi:MAG: queuosine precursor transporter [bacterium]|nr:queuosine precursor transporter [bacterium]